MDVANANAARYEECVQLLDALNSCLINSRRDEFVLLLGQHARTLQIDDIDADYAGGLFFAEFKLIFDEKDTHLDIDDYVHGVRVLNAVVAINKAVDAGDAPSLLAQLAQPHAHLAQLVEPGLQQAYLRSLAATKNFKNGSTTSSTNSIVSDSKNNLSLSDSGHADSEILQSHLLTHADIQECVVAANLDHRNECALNELLNGAALSSGEAFARLAGLVKASGAEKLHIVELNVPLYQTELRRMKAARQLGVEDLRAAVAKANTLLENALNMTKTLLLLNQVDVARKDQVLRLLLDRSLALGLEESSECLDVCYRTFVDLRRLCQKQPSVCSITNNALSEYFWNKTPEEHDFYLNLKSPAVYSWTAPAHFAHATHLVTRTMLKKALDQALQAHAENAARQRQERLATRLQALARGWLCRREIAARGQYLRENEAAVVRVQAWWRMAVERRRYEARLAHQRSNLGAIVAIQAGVRGWLARRDYVRRQRQLAGSVAQVVRLQALVRGRKARQDYKALVGHQAPGLKVVRRFVHLLEHSSADLAQELQLQELKRKVMAAIRTNRDLEHDLDMMDVKIGLLIKNRITLQDVLAQHKRLRKYREDIESGQTSQVKSLSKENHEKMELYQDLFYLLQTRPHYLARLLFTLSPTNSTRFIETVVLQLFNYGANSREEYLLIKLFTASLELEIE